MATYPQHCRRADDGDDVQNYRHALDQGVADGGLAFVALQQLNAKVVHLDQHADSAIDRQSDNDGDDEQRA